MYHSAKNTLVNKFDWAANRHLMTKLQFILSPFTVGNAADEPLYLRLLGPQLGNADAVVAIEKLRP